MGEIVKYSVLENYITNYKADIRKHKYVEPPRRVRLLDGTEKGLIFEWSDNFFKYYLPKLLETRTNSRLVRVLKQNNIDIETAEFEILSPAKTIIRIQPKEKKVKKVDYDEDDD